ncbi:MAG: hypothetical protein KDD42_10195, partial [Bdellovibrionales bacterium]|nr:hypothetical protein [Bdellovibrionales bacterium]
CLPNACIDGACQPFHLECINNACQPVAGIGSNLGGCSAIDQSPCGSGPVADLVVLGANVVKAPNGSVKLIIRMINRGATSPTPVTGFIAVSSLVDPTKSAYASVIGTTAASPGVPVYGEGVAFGFNLPPGPALITALVDDNDLHYENNEKNNAYSALITIP